MKRMLATALTALLALGCRVPPGHKPHPHGAPPGQVKKLYRCADCGATTGAAAKCHGKVMILVP